MTTKRRCAAVYQHGELAGFVEESDDPQRGGWVVRYIAGYDGSPISLALPVRVEPYRFRTFPPFFEGLLPEGAQLEALLHRHKIDHADLFRQLVTVGADLVGSVTVEEQSASD